MFTTINILLVHHTDDAKKEFEKLMGKTLPQDTIIIKSESPRKDIRDLLNGNAFAGFPTLSKIPEKGGQPTPLEGASGNHQCIVVLASDDKTAIEVIEQIPKGKNTNFILKEIDDAKKTHSKPFNIDFIKTMEHLAEILFDKKRIKLKTKRGFIIVNPGKIVFCKAEGNYTQIHLANRHNELTTLQLGKLESLLDPELFIRVNRSITININYLERFDRKLKILIVNDTLQKYEFSATRTGIAQLQQI